MSFFGQKQQGPDPVQMAKIEMETYADLFSKNTSLCFEKCASRKHKTPDLELGEMSCFDRCFAKYMETQEKVGLIMQKFNEAALAQQQSAEEIQAAFNKR